MKRLLALERHLGQAAEIILIGDHNDDTTLQVTRQAAIAHPQLRAFSEPGRIGGAFASHWTMPGAVAEEVLRLYQEKVF